MESGRTLVSAAIILLIFAGVRAEDFAVQASEHVIACNDSDKSPFTSYVSIQLHIRNYSSDDIFYSAAWRW